MADRDWTSCVRCDSALPAHLMHLECVCGSCMIRKETPGVWVSKEIVSETDIHVFKFLCNLAGLDNEEEYSKAREWQTFLARTVESQLVGAISVGLEGLDYSRNEDLKFAGIYDSSQLDIPSAIILMMAVLPNWQHRGIGRLLLRSAEASWLGSGPGKSPGRQIVVATTNDNIQAIMFYQKSGYRLISAEIGAMIGHHSEERGTMGIPMRDVLVLSKRIR